MSEQPAGRRAGRVMLVLAWGAGLLLATHFFGNWEDAKQHPSFLITHRIGLEEGPDAYKTFRDKTDGCVKVVIRPHG